jgi:hypothetical protein
MIPIDLSSPLMQACLWLLLLGLPAALFLGLTLRRLSPATAAVTAQATASRRSLASLWRDRQGTATIEFTLVFPVLLFLIMLLTQSTLLMGATIICNHAAFAATRSAAVIVPLNYPQADEPYNTIVGYQDSYKTLRIRRSAVLAMLPVAGRLEAGSNTAEAQAIVSGLRHHYNIYGREAPMWVDSLIPERLSYAEAYTHITVLQTQVIDGQLRLLPVQGDHTFGPRDPITVRVTHEMNLAVPYVGLIFADGRHASGSGGSTLYTNIISQCTLPNEGIPPVLPPRPELNRIP